MKALVTGGCSYSFDTSNIHTWNYFLAKEYEKSYHTGLDASGNDFIIRRVINQINKIKDQVDEIDCVVLWSGISRKMYVTNKDEYLNHNIIKEHALVQFDRWTMLEPDWLERVADTPEIGTGLVDIDTNDIEGDEYGYTWFVPQITEPRASEYYKKFSNLVNDWEQTTFHIYLLQEFCKANGINLYWGHYTHGYNLVKPPEHLKWAHNEIDFSKCFSNDGMSKWIYEHIGPAGFTPENIMLNRILDFSHGTHPSERGHKTFYKSVIRPFIENSK